jgi:hypothetical protein
LIGLSPPKYYIDLSPYNILGVTDPSIDCYMANNVKLETIYIHGDELRNNNVKLETIYIHGDELRNNNVKLETIYI